MPKIVNRRIISLGVLLIYVFSLIMPMNVSANNESWDQVGAQIFSGNTHVAASPSNPELPQSPANNAPCVADPVYLHSGEFFYECEDLRIPGRGMDLAIKHIYRSNKQFNGQFGYGWTLNYHYRLQTLSNGNVVIVSGNGRKDEYIFHNGMYLTPAGFFETLIRNTDGTWTLTKAHGEKYNFNVNGTIASIVDRNANQISFSYNPSGLMPVIGVSPFTQVINAQVVGYDYQLTQITDTVGRNINLFYLSDGRLEKIVDYAGREILFNYDANSNDLLTVTHPVTPQYPTGLTKTFTYDTNHNLKTITDPKNQTYVNNLYDANRKVYQQDLGTGSFALNYNVASQTTVTNRKGFVTRYVYNAAGNVTLKEEFTAGLRPADPASFITQYEYNQDMLLTKVRYPRGNGIKYIYDSGISVNWTNLVGVTLNGGTITKTAPDGWGNSGAASTQTISGDGGVGFTVTQLDRHVMLGLSNMDTDTNYTTIQYALYLFPGSGIRVFENGADRGAVGGQLALGDFLSVERHGSTITYSKNGAVFYTSAISNTGSLLVDVSLNTSGSEIANARILGGDPRSGSNLTEIRRKTNMSAADNDANDLVTRITYETQFNFPKTVTDPKGYITTYTYDYELPPGHPKYNTKGNLITIDYPMVGGQSPNVEFTYNTNGQVSEVKDPNGNIIHYNYFPTTGYLQSIQRDPSGINAVTQFTYDNFGYPDLVTDANNHVTDYDFNEVGWLIQAKNPRNFLTKYTYDENGNVKKIERQADALASVWQTTEMTYDILNHLKTLKDPLNRITTYNYDNNENLSSVVDAANHTTAYQFDERDKLFKILDANTPQGITQYDYDFNGNLKKIIDANTNATQYTYDLFDRTDIMTYANNSAVNYDYDKNSNLDFVTLPGSHGTIDYVYDPLNRLTNKNYPSHPALNNTYLYDLGSRLTDANNAAAQIHFTYDNLNRIDVTTQTINTIPYVLNNDYDKAGNRTQVIYPSGQSVQYGYDANDNMNRVQASGANNPILLGYDPLDRRVSRTMRIPVTQAISVSYGYDLANQLNGIMNDIKGGAFTSKHTYPLYDNVGNRKQIGRKTALGSETTNYNYNNIYELTGTTGAQTHAYSYDNVANRQVADSVTYTPNNLNQYTSVGGTTYLYDNNGNLTNDGINTYTYDEDNRLSSWTNGARSASYDYDALNRRISKTVNGTTTYFLSDNDREIEEYDSSGGLLAEYIFGSSIDEVLMMRKNNQVYHYFYDGLGSVSEITNNNGVVQEYYSYDPYGKVTIRNGTGTTLASSIVSNPFMFTGRRLDDETGLYHYRARTLDPKTGRFLQRDPIGYYDSMNLYQYGLNNSINLLDPWGLSCETGDKNKDWWDYYWEALKPHYTPLTTEDLQDIVISMSLGPAGSGSKYLRNLSKDKKLLQYINQEFNPWKHTVTSTKTSWKPPYVAPRGSTPPQDALGKIGWYTWQVFNFFRTFLGPLN